MRFLVDAQLPPALARRLAELGHTASHVFDIGMECATDSAILKQAVKTGAVIITKDVDFVHIGRGAGGPQVIWLRLGNVSRPILLERISQVLPQLVAAVENGESVIEVWQPVVNRRGD